MVETMDRTDQASGVCERSSYLKYLPAIYSQSDFMGRFLLVFEDIWGPIEAMLDNISSYFDPNLAPEELLPWLASWVNLVLDETWPLERRRQLVGSAVELFQWRGTVKGLRDYLRIYAGVEPEIIEDYGGIPLDERSRLGWNTVLGEARPYTFTVVMKPSSSSAVDLDKVRAIIDAEKPAHTDYTVRLE
jgi:phage tail-like protein